MKKRSGLAALCICLLFILSGCAVGDKENSIALIYGVSVFFAALLLGGYLLFERKKAIWLLSLLVSVLFVNSGYLWLSGAKSLQAALMANRLSYLGSVFLPLCMLYGILEILQLKRPRWLLHSLLGLGFLVFLLAASPGWSKLYYAEVSLVSQNGVSSLQKVYGPLHGVYLFYLLGYFGGMLWVLFRGLGKKNVSSALHASFLIAAVFLNLGVWLLEQLVHVDFELLSVSYIISEAFLLGLTLLEKKEAELEKRLLDAQEKRAALLRTEEDPHGTETEAEAFREQCAYVYRQLADLTATEKQVYSLYLEGLGTKEVLQALNIKENTLKYHNKNIYSKLGVSSRKELLRIGKALEKEEHEKMGGTL